jgi:hypothetical protein
MTTEHTSTDGATQPLGVGSSEGLGPLVEPVTLADVLDALNLFNRPKPSEDEGPWEAGHYIRVDYLPAFINVIAAAWFSPALTDAQIDAGIEAWFTTDITTNDGKDRGHPFRQRMRAAIDRACGRGPNPKVGG